MLAGIAPVVLVGLDGVVAVAEPAAPAAVAGRAEAVVVAGHLPSRMQVAVSVLVPVTERMVASTGSDQS